MSFQKNYGPCSTDLIGDIPELLKYSFEKCTWNSSWEDIQRGAVMVIDVSLYVNSWLILRCQKEQQEMNRSIMCAVLHIKSEHHLSIQVILEAWKWFWQILVSMNIHVDTWSNSASLPITISTSTTRLTCILTYERESLLSGLMIQKQIRGECLFCQRTPFHGVRAIWHVSRNMSDWHVAFSCGVYSCYKSIEHHC